MSGGGIPSALRRLVQRRAEGRCEYCGMPEALSFASHQIDHIVARKHGGSTDLNNLALSCAICNQHKGTDLTAFDPDTGKIVPLFHPRRQAWEGHFRLNPDGMLASKTPEGRTTIRLLQLNRLERREERHLLLVAGLWSQSNDESV